MRTKIWLVTTTLLLIAGAVMVPAPAQEAPAAGKADPDKAAQDDLLKQADSFAKGLQDKTTLDDDAKAFITGVALQKLRQSRSRRAVGSDKFEQAMDRIRDGLSGKGAADGGAGVRQAAAAWLVEQARGGTPSVNANAALLLGDLRDAGKPWPEGSRMLAGLAADAGLPLPVRVAAMAGLARQIDELTLKAAGQQETRIPAPPAVVDAVSTPLVTIVAAPRVGDDAAGEWLVSRALDSLPHVVPAAAPEAAKALAAVVADPARATDVRVRAAAALGRMATAESQVDAARTVEGIRTLADDAMSDSLAKAKDRALAAALSNMPLQTMQPLGLAEGAAGAGGGIDPAYPLEPLEVQRDAWRLLKLSEAIAKPRMKKDKSGDKPAWDQPLESGVARLLEGTAASSAVDLAEQLRAEAEALMADSTSARLREARTTMREWAPRN